VDRLNIGKMELVLISPPKEAPHGSPVGLPRVRIADFGGEELDHPIGSVLAGILQDGGERRSELGNQVGHDGQQISGILVGAARGKSRLRSIA